MYMPLTSALGASALVGSETGLAMASQRRATVPRKPARHVASYNKWYSNNYLLMHVEVECW